MTHPVVLIHGMWCTGESLSPVAQGLAARGFRCHAPTLPFHERGAVHAEVGPLGLDDYVDFLETWIAAQDFSEPPILVGHSMGGFLAQKLAARAATRPDAAAPFALVLLTPAAPAGILATRPKPTAAFLPTLVKPGFWRRPHTLSRARADRYATTGLPAAQQAAIHESLVLESGRALFELAFWMFDRHKASRVDPESVRCPVYVVSGGRDGLVPAAVVRKVASRYPGAPLRHYPDRGHWVIDDDQTDAMCGEIAAWLLPLEQRAARGLPLRA